MLWRFSSEVNLLPAFWQQLEDTVSHPNVINQINASALLRGNLDLLTGKGEHQLWQQMQVFPAINLIYCATEGRRRIFGRGAFPGWHWQFAAGSGGQSIHQSLLSISLMSMTRGNGWGLSRIDGKLYDPRLRPWYKAAKNQRRTHMERGLSRF